MPSLEDIFDVEFLHFDLGPFSKGNIFIVESLTNHVENDCILVAQGVENRRDVYFIFAVLRGNVAIRHNPLHNFYWASVLRAGYHVRQLCLLKYGRVVFECFTVDFCLFSVNRIEVGSARVQIRNEVPFSWRFDVVLEGVWRCVMST